VTPSQRLAAIAKVLDKYTSYRVGMYDSGRTRFSLVAPRLEHRDFRKLKQLAKPAKRKGKR
jgi:hypothetical protein